MDDARVGLSAATVLDPWMRVASPPTRLCRPLPQQLMVFTFLFVVPGRRRRGDESLHDDRAGRECRPQQDPLRPPAAEEVGGRSGNPEAQAVEAVKQLSPEPGPCPRAE